MTASAWAVPPPDQVKSSSQTPVLSPAKKERIAMEIDTLMRQRFPDDKAPGASVLVAIGGEILFLKGYGIADLTASTPITPETNFRLASVSKQFTAMAIMILAEEGKVSYENRLTDLFPGFPDYGTSITVRRLLNHTSGLKDYEDLIPKDQTEQVHDQDVLELMREAPGTDFSPGSKYSYSNSGYAVLAMIVEKASGMRFAEFLKRRIFEPLGMNATVAYEKGVSEVPHRAFGYKEKEDGEGFDDADQSVTSAVLGDGGIYCSVLDYRKWDQALYTERLVPAARLAEAFTPGVLSDDRPTTYGFGWMIGETEGRRLLSHTGSTSGFNTCVRRIPDLRMLVVVLCNRRGNQARELAPEIEKLVLDESGIINAR